MKIVLDRKEEPMLYATVFSSKLFFFSSFIKTS